jgi:hypothetical protein
MNILRDRRREKLYRAWGKYADLPQANVPQPEPVMKIPRSWRLSIKIPSSLNQSQVIFILLGAVLILLLVTIGLLIANLLN